MLIIKIKHDMPTISIELPENVFAAVRKAPDEFVQEMRIAAAVKWYEIGEVSQGRAAEIAGLTRSDFINEVIAAGKTDAAAQQLPNATWARRIELEAIAPEVLA